MYITPPIRDIVETRLAQRLEPVQGRREALE